MLDSGHPPSDRAQLLAKARAKSERLARLGSGGTALQLSGTVEPLRARHIADGMLAPSPLIVTMIILIYTKSHLAIL